MPHPKHSDHQTCDVCTRTRHRMRDGYRARVRDGLSPGDGRHGSTNGYLNYGCRCERCKAAWRIYNSAEARRARRVRMA